MPRRARRAFDAEAGRAVDIDVRDLQRDSQRRAFAFAMRGPGIGIGMQAVVDVERAQAGATHARVRREQLQQDGGIEAAAEADQQGMTGLR